MSTIETMITPDSRAYAEKMSFQIPPGERAAAIATLIERNVVLTAALADLEKFLKGPAYEWHELPEGMNRRALIDRATAALTVTGGAA